MLSSTQSHTCTSDLIRFGMPREEWEQHNPTPHDGLMDFIGGLSDEEQKYYLKHGHLAGFKEA